MRHKIIVTFNYKIYGYEKMIVALVLASGIAVIACASLQNHSNIKQAMEKQNKQEMNKEGKKKCLFS